MTVRSNVVCYALVSGLATVPTAEAIEVVDTTPSAYALAVDADLATIEVVFDAPPAVPDPTAVRVAGYMSGLHDGTVGVAGNTLTFTNGSVAFLPGELVFVNLRDDIEGPVADPLFGGHYVAFTIASGPVAEPTWDTRLAFGTADRPYFIHGGDLDGDGMPDLALPNEDSNDVSVLLNAAGTGEFPVHAEYAVGSVPSSIFGEDFDNDGDQDLATADIASSTMSVLLNESDGTFSPATTYPAGVTCRQIHGGDFDGDNDIDLCTTSYGSDRIYLFFNEGDGTFAPGVPNANVGNGPFAIRTGDFNLDGQLDIGVANQDSGNLSVLLNNGLGIFVSGGTYTIGVGPWCLNGNDFDGDGDFDLVSVTSYSSPGRLVLLPNNGAGQFLIRRNYTTGGFPLGVYAADLDGDGDVDATSSNFSGASVNIFLNDGIGNLSLFDTLSLPESGTYTWAHDLDGDGDLDISTLDELADSVFVYLTEDTAVSAGDPQTTVTIGPELSLYPNPTSIRAGTPITFSIENAPDGSGTVVVDVFAIDGRRIRRLFGVARGDRVTIDWNGRNAHGHGVAPGAYVVRARVGPHTYERSVRLLP